MFGWMEKQLHFWHAMRTYFVLGYFFFIEWTRNNDGNWKWKTFVHIWMDEWKNISCEWKALSFVNQTLGNRENNCIMNGRISIKLIATIWVIKLSNKKNTVFVHWLSFDLEIFDFLRSERETSTNLYSNERIK